MLNIVYTLIGPPNCGKGTLVEMMANKFGRILGVIPVGEMVTEKLAQDEITHKGLIEQKNSGGFLPTSFVLDLVDKRLAQLGRLPIRIFDGIPRKLDQIKPFNQITRSLKSNCVVIVYINTADEICVERALKRGRSDDAEIRKRLDNFRNKTNPVVDYFRRYSYRHDYSFVEVSGNYMFRDSEEIVSLLIKEAGIQNLLEHSHRGSQFIQGVR